MSLGTIHAGMPSSFMLVLVAFFFVLPLGGLVCGTLALIQLRRTRSWSMIGGLLRWFGLATALWLLLCLTASAGPVITRLFVASAVN